MPPIKRSCVEAEGGLWCQYCQQVVPHDKTLFYRNGHHQGRCIEQIIAAPVDQPDPEVIDPGQDMLGPDQESEQLGHELQIDQESNSDTDDLGVYLEDLEPKARAGSVRWYQEHALDPIYEGSAVTVIQATYLMLRIKHEKNIADGGFDMLLRAVKDVVLPEENLFPPSLHVCEGLAGVEALDQYTYHVCGCGRHVYSHVPKENCHQHYGDACPICSSPRFLLKTVGNTSTWEPNKVRTYTAHTFHWQYALQRPAFADYIY